MTVIKNQLNDSLQLSLVDVVQRVIKTNRTFIELQSSEQREVLDYIKAHNLDLRVFGEKWYDVLTKKFFAIEYLPKEDSIFEVYKEEREFSSFEDFFNYVHGDIYQNACFYGYDFTKEEIDSFLLNYQALNFDSLIDETIENYTFESINGMLNEEHNINVERSKAIFKWFEKLKPITTLEELEAKYKRFTRKFDFWDAKYVFFSMLLRKQKNIVKGAAIQFLCKHDDYDGLNFSLVLLTYGREAALYVIDNFVGECSLRTRKKKIKDFKSSLEGYESGTFSLKRRLGFDESLQLYYVKDRYLNNDNYPLDSSEFFCDFSEFISFVKGDLSNADLSKAPLTRKEIEAYKKNEKTLFPLSRQYDAYKINKAYVNEEFVVGQKWIDEDGFTILAKNHKFKHFFDFVHFLRGNLSGSDLLFCNGLENISNIDGLKLDGIKVRSETAEKLKLPLHFIPKEKLETKGFELTKKFELQTIDNLLIEHPEDDDYSGRISYITDIHLLHRFEAYKCRTIEDRNYVIREIAKTLSDQATDVNLIGGDTSSNFDVFNMFIRSLAANRKTGDFFFTLGNHELWGLNGESLSSIISKYKSALEEIGKGKMHLVQNNIFYLDGIWREVTGEELSNITSEDLRLRMRSARMIIFGGIGFSGMNEEFNADNGIYMDVVDRETEIVESKKFLELYETVTSSLKGKNLIVLTHMPMKDWGGSNVHAKDGTVYVNGHNHRNYFYDDGKKRIYADNQIGYKGKRLSFKQVAVDFDYDWFADYKDGIYEITEKDYKYFYIGIGEPLTFNRQYQQLFMIKRENTYMFFMKTLKGTMLILNGGSIKKTGNHSLKFFYDNLIKYSTSVRLFLLKYDSFQKEVSNEVKRIGGEGYIHGSIVDLDFYNHLYLNPLDGTIIPYFAYSMVDKYVYDNIPSLLKNECPKLFANYKKMIDQGKKGKNLIIYKRNLPVTNNRKYVMDTEMYRISRILKGLQFTTKYNVVRLWNDEIIADASEENGRLIVSGIIDPQLAEESKTQITYEEKLKELNPGLTKKRNDKNRNDEYKNLVSQKTNGKIVVDKYRGPNKNADYVCTICGYSWSVSPDYFEEEQGYKCPICSVTHL